MTGMETIQDFEDMLQFLDKHKVRYLIIGGLAFIYHAKPRYTKDMDLWIDPEPENVKRDNQALADFGSPFLLNTKNIKEILDVITPIADVIITTKSHNLRACDPVILKDMIQDKEVVTIKDISKAVDYSKSIASIQDIICITGSLFTVGEARDYIFKQLQKC